MSPIELAQQIGITLSTEDATTLVRFIDARVKKAYDLGYRKGLMSTSETPATSEVVETPDTPTSEEPVQPAATVLAFPKKDK